MSVAAPALKRFKTQVENPLLSEVRAFDNSSMLKKRPHEEGSLLSSPLKILLSPMRDERLSLPISIDLKGRASDYKNNNKDAGSGAGGPTKTAPARAGRRTPGTSGGNRSGVSTKKVRLMHNNNTINSCRGADTASGQPAPRKGTRSSSARQTLPPRTLRAR